MPGGGTKSDDAVGGVDDVGVRGEDGTVKRPVEGWIVKEDGSTALVWRKEREIVAREARESLALQSFMTLPRIRLREARESLALQSFMRMPHVRPRTARESLTLHSFMRVSERLYPPALSRVIVQGNRISYDLRGPADGVSPDSREVEYSNSILFTGFVVSQRQSGGRGHIRSSFALSANTNLYLRARSRKGTRYSEWSPVESITIIINEFPAWSAVPKQTARINAADTTLDLYPYVTDPDHTDQQLTLAVPTDDQNRPGHDIDIVRTSITGGTIMFDWQGTAGTTTVTVLATDPLGAEAAVDIECETTDPCADLAVGIGDFETETILEIPGTPGLSTSPGSGTSNFFITITAPTTGGAPDDYELEILTRDRNNIFIYRQPGTYRLGGFTRGRHRVRVRGRNAAGVGPWSGTRTQRT